MIRCLIKLLGQKSQIQIKASVHSMNIGGKKYFVLLRTFFLFI